MYDKPKSYKTRLIWLAVLVAVPLVLFGGPIKRYWLSRPFCNKHFREYKELYEGKAYGKVRSGTLPYRTGKVIVIRPSTHAVQIGGSLPETLFWTEIEPFQRNRILREEDPCKIDDSWYKLSSSLRAGSPEEVDTVIFCESRNIKVGMYTEDPTRPGGNYAAYRRDFVLKVYDRKSGSFIGEYVVEGEAPPEETTVMGRHQGKPPDVAKVISTMELKG